MKFSGPFLFLLVTFFAYATAYSVQGGSVSLNNDVLFKINPKSLDAHRVTLESAKDIIKLSVDIKAKRQPHQLMFLFSNNAGLDHAVFATFSNGVANADISVNKLPSALKKAERIFVSIIAADSESEEQNVNYTFAELVPSQALQSSVEHKKPQRLGALPEIHHIFKEDAKTTNAVVPVVFGGLAIALFVVLLGSWVSVLKAELFGEKSGLVFKASLLSTLAYFELTVFKYYLGASIFSTLFQVLLLAGPFLFFSSRALSSLARARTGRED